MFHLVEGLALVMLCQCRLCPRRLSVHILKEIKNLFKPLSHPDGDLPVIDVIDRCCPDVIEKCLGKSFLKQLLEKKLIFIKRNYIIILSYKV